MVTSNVGAWRVESYTTSAYCSYLNSNINEYLSWVVLDPKGVQHPVDLHTYQTICPGFPQAVTEGPTTDGSGTIVNVGSNPMLTLKDGTQIPLSGSDYVFSAVSMEDTNGNMYTSLDTLGRTIATVTSGSGYTTYTVHDSAGNPQDYRIDYTTISEVTSFCGTLNNPPYYTCNEPDNPSFTVPSKITLPNGTTYQFSWNNNTPGELSSITLPTGGSISYAYVSSPNTCLRPNLVPGGSQNPTTTPYTCRAEVTSRTQTVNGVGSTWSYSSVGGHAPFPTVTDPLGNQQVHGFSQVKAGNATSYGAVETEVDYYQGSSTSGKLLRKVVTAYTGEPDLNSPGGAFLVNVRPVSVTTTLDNGSISQTQTDYETFTLSGQVATRTNPTEIREYDYGNGSPGPLLRKTDYTYLHNSNQTYANLNIVDRPTSVIVYNGAGTIVSQTQYEYDNYTAGIQLSGAVQHDSARGASYLTRRNVTAVERWRNTDGSWLTTRNQYDDAGNVLTQTDPRGNATTFSYVDKWSPNSPSCVSGSTKAFPTTVTYPTTVTNKAVTTYNACDGSVYSVQDQNDLNNSRSGTVYTYDSMWRVTNVSYPDGGNEATNYGGSTLPEVITRTVTATPSPSIVSTQTLDGLGRTSQTALTSDTDGVDTTVTTYDLLGRVYTVTNPYFSTTDPTYGITTYTYDALGRTCLTVPPGGTAGNGTCPTTPTTGDTTTIYTGRATSTTDESAKQRISQTDGVGRLVAACEVTSATLTVGITGSTVPAACNLDISATGFATTYSYDALNDLTSVTQGPLSGRSFTYNSLGQLTIASNPESGIVCYGTLSGSTCQQNGYDANGNLIYKTDARGTKVTYAYDADNRLTGKTYSDTTPAVTYNYDETSSHSVTLTNTTGRKSSETTAGTYPTPVVFSYDPMGRVLNNSQQAINSVLSTIVYTYDLAGNILTASVPGAGTITNTYNGASRISGSTTNYTVGGSPTTLISSPHYNALSQLVSQALGTGLNESWTYNNRAWQTGYALKNGSNSVYSYSLMQATNGNVLTSNDTVNGNWAYGYDDFNRLTSSSVTGMIYRGPQSYTYVYDRFGNRWQQNITSGTGDTSSLAFDANNHITGSGVTYDAAGDVTNDGTNTYVYDAEGRIASVNSGAATYVYDAEGQRVGVVDSARGQISYYYDLNGRVVFEGSTGGRVRRRILRGWTPSGHLLGHHGIQPSQLAGYRAVPHDHHRYAIRTLYQQPVWRQHVLRGQRR